MRLATDLVGMAGTMEILSLVLVFVVHVIGAGFLVWALAGDEGFGDLRGWWPKDDQPDDDAPRDPGPDAPAGGLALPESAAPSGVRLREPGRIGERKPRPARRPEHAPEPDRRPGVPAGRDL
jgi:hypothetical protein